MAKNELPELMTVMMKVVERLEVLERKMDQVIDQTLSRASEGREHPKPASQPFVSASQNSRRLEPSPHSKEVPPVPAQSPRNRERVLHKAVCADCKKDCEIPFKPTGERPVYCKECFSKRKGGNSFKGNHGNKPASDPVEAPAAVNSPQRHVSVTKKGVGKVTVSEIVRPSAHDSASKQKSHKPVKKSK